MLRRTYGADRLVAAVAASNLFALARHLMSLPDRPSIITAFITSLAAMPTPANLCGVIAVSYASCLAYLLCLASLPARYRHALLCSRLSARGPTLPFPELTN